MNRYKVTYRVEDHEGPLQDSGALYDALDLYVAYMDSGVDLCPVADAAGTAYQALRGRRGTQGLVQLTIATEEGLDGAARLCLNHNAVSRADDLWFQLVEIIPLPDKPLPWL